MGAGNLRLAERGQRLRLGLEGQYAVIDAGGARWTPRLELGVREDAGDAETGSGIELGGGLVWHDARLGLVLAGRTLVTHEASGLVEQGLSLSLDYDPRPGSARGLQLSLRQETGARSTEGLDALFASPPLAARSGRPREPRLTLSAGYGLAVFSGRVIAGPQAALSYLATVRDYRLGWRLVPAVRRHDLSLELTAVRREHDRQGAEHAIALGMTARW